MRAAGFAGIELIRAEDLLHVRERGRQLLEGLRSTPATCAGSLHAERRILAS